MVSSDFRDQDVFGFYREGEVVEIVVLSIRNGKLLGRRNFSLQRAGVPRRRRSCRRSSRSTTTSAPSSPTRCSCPSAVDDARVKAEWLSEKRGERSGVEVLAPQRGPRHELVELAQKNAASSFVTRRDKTRDAEAALGSCSSA